MEDEQIIDEQIEKKYKMKKELEELKGKIATNEGEKVRFKIETKNWLGFSEPFLAKEKSNLNISRYTLMAIIDEMLDKIKKDLDDLTKKRAELRGKEGIMLKIKDSVDLKELEKFGYFFDKKDNTYIKKIHKTSDYTYFTVYINLKNRRIEVSDGYSYSFYINDEDTEKYIDDLIQAGLVEKGE